MKTQNSVSQKIWILHKINNKKDIFNRNVRLLKSMFTMHSILGWGSFCMNYCINAAWHGGNRPVAPLRCNESPGCFDSGLQVSWFVGSGVTIPHRLSIGFRSGEFAGQSSTLIPWSLNKLLVPLLVWAGAKSAGKWNQHLHKAYQQKESMKAL